MQSNEYAYDAYDAYGGGAVSDHQLDDDHGLLVVPGQPGRLMDINYEDPKIAAMPKILLMGPRRGGKTSIQVRGWCCCVLLCCVVLLAGIMMWITTT
jgi:hypothetical protein